MSRRRHGHQRLKSQLVALPHHAPGACIRHGYVPKSCLQTSSSMQMACIMTLQTRSIRAPKLSARTIFPMLRALSLLPRWRQCRHSVVVHGA